MDQTRKKYRKKKKKYRGVGVREGVQFLSAMHLLLLFLGVCFVAGIGDEKTQKFLNFFETKISC